MLACVDVYYHELDAVAACLVFQDWTDERAEATYVIQTPVAGDYRPGHFYERELPALLAVLGRVPLPLDAVIIDGYVWLGSEEQPGLGAHLYDALGRRTPVIGVAKTAYRGSSFAVPVMRGEAKRPLYVTAAGIDAGIAASHIAAMHGPYRVPTLLRAVDQRSRLPA